MHKKIKYNPANQKIFLNLWRQFLPLSMSDVTMACAEPLVTTTLARLPLAVMNLGALGIAKTIAIFFESPIIMILHASNALAPTQASRQALWQFTLWVGAFLSIGLELLALPGVFALVGNNILGVPAELTDLVRQVLIVMGLWPFAIAWRRYFQGLLIQAGHAKPIVKGSFVRLATTGLVLLIGLYVGMTGAILGGLAFVSGAVVEAVVITWLVYSLGVNKPPSLISKDDLPSNIPEVWRFYWPLACSMVLVWGGRTILIGIIARSLQPDLALAIWPAAWGLISLIANATRMVQQIVIKNRGQVPDHLLVIFTISVGLVCSGILLLISTTSLGKFLIEAFVGGDRPLMTGIGPVLLLCTFIPLAVALQNGCQGFLVSVGRTLAINQATFMGIFILLIVTWLGIQANLSGAIAAGLGMSLSLLIEIIYLGWQVRQVDS